MRPASAARRAATASTSSSVLVGTSVTRLARPGAWPLRPARCSRRATPFAEPICSTRSTGRKSTPRSSDEVATTAFSRPSLRPSSTQSRTSLSSEPWCSATTPAQSGRASRMQLVPGLGLRAHVDEDERRRRARDLVDDRLLHLLAEVAAPREAARIGGQQRVDDEVLLDPAAHDQAGARGRAARASPRRGCRASPRGPRRRDPGSSAAGARARAAPARRACCPSARATRRR